MNRVASYLPQAILVSMEGQLLGTATSAPISAAANGDTQIEFEITVEALIADLPGLFREKFVVSILV